MHIKLPNQFNTLETSMRQSSVEELLITERMNEVKNTADENMKSANQTGKLVIVYLSVLSCEFCKHDEEDEWDIEKLIDRRRKRNRLVYLVRWKGWSSEYDEWNTVDQLKNARGLMRDYDQANLDQV